MNESWWIKNHEVNWHQTKLVHLLENSIKLKLEFKLQVNRLSSQMTLIKIDLDILLP